MKLYGKKLSRREITKKVGRLHQAGGTKHYELRDGKEKGVEAVDFRTGSGFNFTVLPGRGMDIAFAEYNGRPLCWSSSTGYVSAEYYIPEGYGWSKSFFGGLLTTCGLTYLGCPCVDQGRELGLHGRVSNIPAKNVSLTESWKGDECTLELSGKVTETAVRGENMRLTRKISARLGESRLFIDDLVENLGVNKTEHMILYHFNFGYPVLDSGTKLISPAVKVKPRDAEAEKGKSSWSGFSGPVAGFKEQVFYHKMKGDKSGKVRVALINEAFNNGQGFGVYIEYSLKQLPCFVQWKMMDEGTYVVGLEPANCLVEGRDKERKRGTLDFIEPGGKRKYHVEVGVLPSNKEISAYRKNINPTK